MTGVDRYPRAAEPTTGTRPAENRHGTAMLSDAARKTPVLALITLCLASFMASLDMFAVNVALHRIGVQLGGGALSSVSWVINAYSIFFGALLIPAGRLADHFGRKAVFLVGLAIFTLASVACAVSPDLWALIAFRCLQAVGAAALVPASLGLVLATMPAGKTRHGVRIWAVTGSVAGATGPVIGGLLTQFDWRWVFLINLPIGVVALVSAIIVVPAPPKDHRSVIPHPVEVAAIIVSLGALALGIVKGPDWGWSSLGTCLSWAVAAAAIVIFLSINRKARQPVIQLSLFRNRFFSSANAGMVLYSASIVMTILGMTLFLQQNWHWSAIATGAAIAPGPACLFLTSQVLAATKRGLSMATMISVGFLVVAAGLLLMIVSLHAMAGSHDYAAAILPGWALTGVGSGLCLPPLTGAATVGLPAEASSVGSAAIQVARQLGTVMGAAVLVAVLGAAATTGAMAPFLRSWWIAVVVCVIGSAVTALGLHRHPE